MAMTIEQNEERVQAILSHPLTTSHVKVSCLTGFDREIVRRIRFGIKFKDILPDLPRIDPKIFNRKCYHCVQWEPDTEKPETQGSCGLGFPECKSEGPTWARGCGAFSQAGEEE